MLEKLLSLLLHAKSGAVATVLVLGTSGALVTATVNDGVTTITLTQPSENSTAGSTTTTNTTVEQAILALFNRTSAEDDPTSTATAKGCSDEAHERNEQMKRVNDASHEHRDDVGTLGREADGKDAKKLVKDADAELKGIRQAAVKAIHATFDCDPNEDEDADVDADEDEDENEGDDEDTTSITTSTNTTVTSLDFTGDAKAIADLAIALMEEVVEKLVADLEGLEDADEETTGATTNENGKSDKKDNKGKGGNGKGRNR